MRMMSKNKNNSITPITAAGGVVVRKPDDQPEADVLLIFRRGVWDLPKGKLEDEETVEECAVREVAEEVGLSTLPRIISSLSDTFHEYHEDGVHYGKTTHWYVMELSSGNYDLQPQQEEGIKKVKWYTLSEAKEKVGYDNLLAVLSEVEDYNT